MSRRSGDGMPVGRAGVPPVILAALALVLTGALAFVGVAPTGAQGTPEASPMASPAAGPCEAPEDGTTAIVATPMASPVADEGTPEAEATEPIGTPVEDDVAEDAVAAVENFANCWNAGDLDAVLALVTPNLIQTKFGAASADEARTALQDLGELPQYTVLSTGDVQSYDDGRVSVDVEYMLGQYQYVDARWFLVEAGDQLLIDEEELLPPMPEGDTTAVGVLVSEDDPTTADVDETGLALTGGDAQPPFPVVIFQALSTTPALHVLTIFRLAEGTEATPVTGTPAGGEFVGQIATTPGDPATRSAVDIALLNLEPGAYAVVDLAGGFSVVFTVSEPAA